ncbi:hypothetical protein PIB30_007908 [Stylosanthes scabra]|uniref:Uncharacterized protein n=1 Tax=Stylosanthes scabra TaxID=79078 RepID=A0ABU6S4Y0_9FABA|nr:hypothetical protein [Stylosanthes scabra]
MAWCKKSFFQFATTNEEITPSQLHPNSWVIVCCFELVSNYLHLPVSECAFFFLFKLTVPNSMSGQDYLSLRAHPSRKIFTLRILTRIPRSFMLKFKLPRVFIPSS